MRIGILTFHRAINYGAFLQAFALKTYLSSLGYEVEVVDYWPVGHADAYRLYPRSWKKISFTQKVKFLISLALRYNRAKKRRNGMLGLIKNYLGLGTIPRYETPESLSDISYDCVVYGSDQIWWKSNIPEYSGFDSVYWGEYIQNAIRKIAYAPSMGIIDLNTEDKDKIRKWLCNFEALSVRETELCQSLKELTDKNIFVVLDPVFLLSETEWENYCIPVRRTKYVLYYNLLSSKEADKLAEVVAKKMQCDIVEITGSVRPLKFGRRYVQTADAFEFISLVKYADFVITSSFHGTAFSLIFRKQFYSIGMGKRAGRVVSLLEQLGVSERLIKNVDMLPDTKIDYEKLQLRLQTLTQNSRQYLERGVCGFVKNSFECK